VSRDVGLENAVPTAARVEMRSSCKTIRSRMHEKTWMPRQAREREPVSKLAANEQMFFFAAVHQEAFAASAHKFGNAHH
jgi:hypothetical protein